MCDRDCVTGTGVCAADIQLLLHLRVYTGSRDEDSGSWYHQIYERQVKNAFHDQDNFAHELSFKVKGISQFFR